MQFAHGAETVNAAARHEAKVADVVGKRLEEKDSHQPVKKPCRGALKNVLAFANGSLTAHDVVAVPILRNHFVNHIEWILQIGIDENHCVAGDIIHSRGRSYLVAEVAGEAQDFDAAVARAPIGEEVEGAVGTSIVHQD